MNKSGVRFPVPASTFANEQGCMPCSPPSPPRARVQTAAVGECTFEAVVPSSIISPPHRRVATRTPFGAMPPLDVLMPQTGTTSMGKMTAATFFSEVRVRGDGTHRRLWDYIPVGGSGSKGILLDLTP